MIEQCIMIEQGDATRPAVDSSEPSEAVRNRRRNTADKILSFQDFGSQNKAFHNCIVFRTNSKNKFSEFICDQQILALSY